MGAGGRNRRRPLARSGGGEPHAERTLAEGPALPPKQGVLASLRRAARGKTGRPTPVPYTGSRGMRGQPSYRGPGGTRG
eukprot:3036379-Alexandrium_andersonii.AAC.1